MTGEKRHTASWAKIIHVALGLLIMAAALVAVSFFPVRHTEVPPFASPDFQHVWSSETVAAARGVDLWGSEPLSWRIEAYAGAPNDRRTVQYFERGRMEVEAGSSQVTHGRLALELTTGKIDLGQGVALERQPPEISIDSGALNDEVPTYLTLGRLVGQPDTDRTSENQRITAWVHRGGQYERSAAPDVVVFRKFIEETGHNLPDVTVDLFAQPEFRENRWVEVIGYPISEPYWSYYRRGDEKLPSLVQVFERRILVYTPGMEEGRKFTIANSGRHYSIWRYGTDPQSTPSPIPADAVDPALSMGGDLSAYIYADDLGSPLDLSLSPTGHLLILTREGNILRSNSLDPVGQPNGFSVWASGIMDPQGMATRGHSVLVTAGDRIWWYREKGGVGVRDEAASALELPASPVPNIRSKPFADESGRIYARTSADGVGEVLREIGSDEPVFSLGEVIDNPGPLMFAGGDLVVAGIDDDGRSSVYLLPAIAEGNESIDPIRIATFPKQSSVRALAIADEVVWPISQLGDVLIAVDDGDDCRIFVVSRRQDPSESEVIELASGLNRPSAMLLGLDGSIYVADEEQGRVIRILRSAPADSA